jgi:hypothetical protein
MVDHSLCVQHPWTRLDGLGSSLTGDVWVMAADGTVRDVNSVDETWVAFS